MHNGIVCFVYDEMKYNLFRILLSKEGSVYYNMKGKKNIIQTSLKKENVIYSKKNLIPLTSIPSRNIRHIKKITKIKINSRLNLLTNNMIF